MTFSHLHDTTLPSPLQGYAVAGTLVFLKCAAPVVIATMLAGLLAGAIQNRFNTASEALTPNWNRLNPVEGFKRVFSFRSAVPTLIAILKFAVIVGLTYSQVRSILNDPIFTTAVSVGRLTEFLAQTCLQIFLRVSLALLVIAAGDYGYQWWRTQQDLMMTKEELKEEMKSTEGNQMMKSARRRRRTVSKAKQLAEVPKADVVVTNPTHIAIALRYDRKTMRAPKVVAKGIRLNAQSIREIAARYQIPIIENKPLARMLFKHGAGGWRGSRPTLCRGRRSPRVGLSREPLPVLRGTEPEIKKPKPFPAPAWIESQIIASFPFAVPARAACRRDGCGG